MTSRFWRGTAAALLIGASLAACGGDDDAASPEPDPIQQKMDAAERVDTGEFPRADGRALAEIAQQGRPGLQFGLATSVYVPGRNRFAFGLIDEENKPLFAPAVVYLAPSPGAPAQGPFAAPLDPMVAAPRFSSDTVAGDPASPKGIYSTQLRLDAPREWAAVILVKSEGGFFAVTTGIPVSRSSEIPGVGERVPAIETPTVESAGGDIERIETRVPPDTMHDVSFREVVGKRPVALLFATPALCHSRTCGPVTDLAEQLKAEYGERMTFIHQEIYVQNDPSKGLRPQLRMFNLETEPWLFTFDRRGRVAARLEGAFGINDFRRSVEAALR